MNLGTDTQSDTQMTTKHRYNNAKYNNHGRAATKSFLVSDNTCVCLYCTRIIKCHVLLTAETETETETETEAVPKIVSINLHKRCGNKRQRQRQQRQRQRQRERQPMLFISVL